MVASVLIRLAGVIALDLAAAAARRCGRWRFPTLLRASYGVAVVRIVLFEADYNPAAGKAR